MRILLIGDSIRLGYQPHVRRLLLGEQMEVLGPEENCETSSKVVTHVNRWIESTKPDLVHFNCGLHDLRINPGDSAPQTSLTQYVSNLRTIFQVLRDHASGPHIWATSTPVVDARHNLARQSTRHAADVLAYNQASLAVASELGSFVHDLHGKVSASPVELIGTDGVHFTEQGYRWLGEEVARCVLQSAQAGLRAPKAT